MDNIQLRYDNTERFSHDKEIVVIAEALKTPINVGSIFRIAEAFGVSKIIFTERSIAPPNRKIRKTSRAAELHLPYEIVEHTVDAITQLRDEGFQIFALELTETATPIEDFAFKNTGKLAIIIGAERDGVAQPTLGVVDHTIYIKMYGKNSSINVATALGIALFQITNL